MKHNAWGVKGPDGISINSVSSTYYAATCALKTAINQYKDPEHKKEMEEALSVVPLFVTEYLETQNDENISGNS